jgi:hypothetical protein
VWYGYISLKGVAQPGPIVTLEGFEEYTIEEIMDSQQHRCGYQFLVCWLSYSHEHDEWITSAKLNNCEVLDCWYQLSGDGLDAW